MAIPRYIKWPLWFLLAIVIIVGLSVLSLLTETVQTSIGRYALTEFNKSLDGKIEFASVHVTLHGKIVLTDLSIKDSHDKEIIGLSKLRATVDPWGLLDNRVHLLQLKLTGLRSHIEMDSTGNNITAILPVDSPSDDTSTSGDFNWQFIADRIEIEGERTIFELDQATLLDLDSWTLDASGSYIDNLIVCDLDLNAEQGIALKLKANTDLSGELPAVQADLETTLDSLITAYLPDPVFKLGTIQLTATADFKNDSLNAEFDFASSAVGKLSGETTLRDPAGFFFGTGELTFEHLNIAPFMEDSSASNLNGSLSFTRSQINDFVNGWNANLSLNNSNIMDEQLTTELAILTEDSTAWIDGEIATPFGGALLDLVIGGFDPEKMSAAGELSINNVNLHHFAPDIPDSLSPLSGAVQLDFPSLNPDSLAGQTYVRLNKLQYGRHRLDSAVVYASIDGQTFEVDTMKLQLDDVRVSGSMDGELGGDVDFNLNGVIPELADIGELLLSFDIELDSVSGYINWDLSGSASLAGDSLSGLTVHGDVRLDSCRYGDYLLERAGARITEYRLDDNHFSAAVGAFGIHVSDQLIDSVKIVAQGDPSSIHTSADVWALSDTLQLSTVFSTAVEPDQITISLDELTANTFDAVWKTAFPTDIYLIDDRVEIDGIQLSSSYGVLRAIGYLQAEGDQDFTLELSGFRTENVAKLLELDLPSANINIRLQVTGTDTALTGDIAVNVDSMIYDGNLVSDELYLFANILRDKIEVEGYSTWYSDTLTTFSGRLPARLSFNDGFTLYETEPLSGSARVFDQPLARLNPWLAVGTKADGILAADMNISGTPDDPDWEGFFSVREGRYIDPRIGVNYRYIVLDGKLRNDSLIIDQFRATARGTLSGSGYAVMGLPTPEYLNLNIKFDRFNAQNSPRQKARLTGMTTITGPFDSLDVQGNLKIEELLYRITQATSKDIETIDLESYLAKLRGDSVLEGGFLLSDLYGGMSHDLRIEIPGNCWMRGGGINIELFGDLSLYKEKNSDPVVNGDINVRRGTVELVGHELKVETGVVTFTGPIDDPELDITAMSMKLFRREDAEVRARVYGPVSNTRIDFSGRLSDGTELTPEQCVKALLLGTTASGGDFDINQSAASIAAAPISQLIEKKSGLDVFQFRPGDEGINDLSSGSLEVGTYLTDRLFIRVLQPIETIQSGQEVSIEYQLKEWLKLIAEQKGREQSAFDIFVQLEWR